MKLTVVIPAWNEEAVIARTIRELLRRADGTPEVIVSDGGCEDDTAGAAQKAGADRVVSEERGRACQMNAGARFASGDVLYFLHADTLPPPRFDRLIAARVEAATPAGCFRLSFDSPHPLLNCYAWFTRFDVDAFRFGDQSLFVTRDLFRESGGFREDHIVMEDNELVRRLKSHRPFAVMEESVTTSSRNYRTNGPFRLQLIFAWIWCCYHLGVPQHQLIEWYREWVKG